MPSYRRLCEDRRKGRETLEPILQVKHLTHTYSVGTPFQRSAVEDMSFEVMRGRILRDHRPHRLRQIHPDPASERPAEAHAGADLCSNGRTSGRSRRRSGRCASRWGWCSSIRSISCLRRRCTRTSPSAPPTWGKTGEELDRRVREAARLVGIREDQLEKSPFELSGGQKRRVALAGVMAMEPEVLVLDEPTAGLDPGGREKSHGQHPGLPPQKKRATIILVSHSMDEIARNVERILVLQGRPRLMERHAPAGICPGGGAALRGTGCAAGDPDRHGAARRGLASIRRSIPSRSWSGSCWP